MVSHQLVLVALICSLLMACHPAAAVVLDPTPDGPGQQEQQAQALPQPPQAARDNNVRAAEMLAGPGGPAKQTDTLLPKAAGCRDFIVQLKDPSAVEWASRTEASAAGDAGAGSGRVSSTTLASGSVRQYAAFLKTQANAVATRALGSSDRIAAHYQYSFAGMYVQCVSPGKLAALQSDPGVASVSLNRVEQLATISTPHFLGLDAPGGAWAQLGGLANAGEDVVIGVLDSGYWPESGSFSDQADPNTNNGGAVYGPPPAGFTGTCDSPGANEPPGTKLCNNKVVACRNYPQGWVNETHGILDIFPKEYASCRGYNSHGSHTASTAGGNTGVVSDLVPASFGRMSGMAPRTRIAVYKVCWGDAGCALAAILAGIDQAIQDGVHVLSFSISGSTTDLEEPVQVAFKNAAAAGIFVSASAGNIDSANKNPQPVQSIGPWLTTVGASTHNRLFKGTVKLGDPQQPEWAGAGLFTPSPFGPHPLVLSDDVGLPGAKPEEVQLCYNGTLDPEKVRGKIVVCDRGVSARVDKSAAVKLAGGVGMLLLNTPKTTDDVASDAHAVPTVHLPRAARDPVRAYTASAGAAATAAMTSAVTMDDTAPQMASFSKKGPCQAASGNLLKPDVTAPGVGILAAASPPSNQGKATAFMQGTSMSTPHISGIAALIKQRHPTWSPMMIKSAIMTTAYQTTKTGPSPGQVFGGPFDFGAGHVDPTAALNPGLVFDSTPRDWERFVCGAQLLRSDWEQRCPECLKDASLCDVQRLNTPSIAAATMLGKQTIIRTVTSVLSEAAQFTVSITNPSGFAVVVTPAAFSLQPGESAALSITITRVDAPLDTYAAGAISWSSSKGTVTRTPVVAKTSLLQPEAWQWRITGRNGQPLSFSYNVATGFTGTLSTLAVGMEPARVFEGTVTQSDVPAFDFSNPAGMPGTTAVQVSVLPGKRLTYVRLALFSADMTSPETDVDMYVYDSQGRYLGGSGGPTADEEVNLMNPATSSVTVFIHGYKVSGGSAGFKLHAWVLRLPSPGSSNAKSLPHAGSPAPATIGGQVPVTVSFSARVMDPSKRFLGIVMYATNPVDDGRPDAVPFDEATLIYLV